MLSEVYYNTYGKTTFKSIKPFLRLVRVNKKEGTFNK